MEVYMFQVRTTRAVIDTAATSHEAAVKQVMAAEGCPRSAIISITILRRIA